MAQSEEDDAALDEIIVTSTRREKAVMDVNQSIQAIPEATLELPTFSDLSQVHNLVPGATTFSNKAPNKEGIQFRGSGIIQSGASDGLAPVGYYVDDIPYVDISTPVPPPIGTFDLNRIEIIRGPQGTSYGQDSSAGSVILRTNPVDLENFGFKARVGMSDVKDTSGTGYTVGGVLNIPIAKDVFGIRLSYQREEDPGYGRVDTVPEIENPLENTRDSFRVKAYWQAGEKVDIELTHSEWNTEYGTLPGTQILDSSGGEMVLNPVSTTMLLALFPNGELKNDFEIKWTTWLARFDIGFAELTYSGGLVDTPKKETNSEFIFDIGLGPQESAVVFNQPAETTTHELRMVSTSDSNLQWIAGAFFMEADSDSQGFTETPDFFIYEQISDPIESEVMAIYGEIEYAFNDQWSIQAGLRYHDEDRTQHSFYSLGLIGCDPMFGPYTCLGPPEVWTENTSFDYTSYRVALTWTPSENGMVYLTNATANRAPIILGQSERQALEAAGISGADDLDEAKLNNWELGTKWTLADGRLQLEAAYVYGDWTEIPMWADVNIPPQPVAMPIGGTDADIETWEIGLAWAITDSFTFTYAGAFTDTEVKKTPPAGTVDGYPGAVQEGGELFNYSPTTHNVGLSFDRSFGGDWGFFASVNYVTRDKPDGINVFVAPDSYIPARDRYENLGINLGLSKGNWDFTLAVLNATDDDGQYLPRTSAGGSDARLFGLIQPPRTLTFMVSYDGMK
jgi:outer membrane receptor protein involved in Fe transport